MKSTRMKRLVSGGLTALLAAAVVLPASASAASNETDYKTHKTYKTYTVYSNFDSDYSDLLNYLYSLPWFQDYAPQLGQGGNQGTDNGTTGGNDQNGGTQGDTEQGNTEQGNTDQGNTQQGNTQQGNTQNGTSGNSGNTAQQGDMSQFASQVITLVNQERAKQGLKSLTADDALNKVALAKAQDMSQNNYFDHTSPTYGSPFEMMKKFGISYSYAGENIAKGQKTPTEVVNAWMNSAGHRANILNANYTHIGVGYYNGYWAQEFVGR